MLSRKLGLEGQGIPQHRHIDLTLRTLYIPLPKKNSLPVHVLHCYTGQPLFAELFTDTDIVACRCVLTCFALTTLTFVVSRSSGVVTAIVRGSRERRDNSEALLT